MAMPAYGNGNGMEWAMADSRGSGPRNGGGRHLRSPVRAAMEDIVAWVRKLPAGLVERRLVARLSLVVACWDVKGSILELRMR